MLTTPRMAFRITEVGETLGIGRTLAYRLVLRGELPSIKIGRSRRVPAAAVEAYVARLIEEQNQQPAPSAR